MVLILEIVSIVYIEVNIILEKIIILIFVPFFFGTLIYKLSFLTSKKSKNSTSTSKSLGTFSPRWNFIKGASQLLSSSCYSVITLYLCRNFLHLLIFLLNLKDMSIENVKGKTYEGGVYFLEKPIPPFFENL